MLFVNDVVPSVVYMDVINFGFSLPFVLRQSASFDVVTCGEAVDVDLDGDREVVLGTAGEQLNVYKWSHAVQNWTLQFSKRMNDPVHAVRTVDLTGDGLEELVVQTTKVSVLILG